MAANDHTRIAVVGAGPTGLLTALLLERSGLDVTLFGTPQTEDEHRRTAALLQGSVELIREAGVWDLVGPEATPLEVMRLVDDTGRLLRAPTVTFRAEEIGEAAFGYNIGTAHLSRILADAYDGPAIRHAVEGIDAGETCVLHTEDGGSHTADIIVGADGRGSVVREKAGIDVWHWSYDQAALVTVVEHEFDHDYASTEFHRAAGPFVLVPMQGRRSSVVYCGRPDEIGGLMEADAADVATTLGEASHWLLGDMTLVAPRQVYPLSSFVAKSFADGPFALVGEAAHGFPPIGAQGLNLGLRDVSGLVTALRADVSQRALRSYAEGRRADVLTRTAGVDALNRSLLTGFLPVQAGRAAALFAASASRLVRRAMMREGMQPLLGR